MLNDLTYIFKDLKTGSEFYVSAVDVTEELMEKFELISISFI